MQMISRGRAARRAVLTAILFVSGLALPAPSHGQEVPTYRKQATEEIAHERWVLEFGPYIGYYDFDQLTAFKDFGLFGARAGVHLSSWLCLEGEFDEVYTQRHRTGNRARQISFGLHARLEPGRWRLAPMALIGGAFVMLDDTEDADAYGEALDLGAGLRFLASPRWILRAEWMLRRQPFQLHREVEGEEGPELQSEAVTLWGRAYRLGVSYVF